MPVYQNFQGKVYTAATPQSPNDQLRPGADPDFAAVLSATPQEENIAKAAFLIQQSTNGKIKKGTSFAVLLAFLAGSLLSSEKADAAPPISPTGNVPGAVDYLYDPISGLNYEMMNAPGAPGVQASNSEGTKATYSAAFAAVTPAASATDIFTITGSATKTIRVLRVGFSCTAGTAANFTASLIKRSSVDTGGTSTAITPTLHDTTYDPAATATVAYYTANPSALGTSAGLVRAAQIYASASGLLLDTQWDFGTRNGQSIVLRGVTQQLAINMNNISLSSGVCSGNAEFSEE